MTKAVAKTVETEVVSFDTAPDYLPAEVKTTGLEALGKDDFKTPRILLLQGLSPEVTNFPETARVGHFWHTGMNMSLGDEFTFVPLIASKRVILFRPRTDKGGGILAFSRNGKDWATGGNSEFTVKLRDKKETVVWKTGKNVAQSGLTEFGTMDPDAEHSPPAALIFHEYLVYLPNAPQLSPCVLGLSKTALPNAKSLNTSLLTIAKTGKPITCVAVRAFAEEKSNEDGKWTVPNFKLMGYASKEVYDRCSALAEQYADYQTEYQQEDNGTSKIKDDEIPF